MNTIITPLNAASHRNPHAPVNPGAARKPHYDCREQGDALQVVVYVPGVDASGVEITTRGPDLTVTARKTHFVRVNWQALHLEGAQRDYQLRLQLGHGLDYAALQAEIRDGVLTLTLPKKQPEALNTARDRLRPTVS